MVPYSEFEPAFQAQLASANLKTFDDFWNFEWTWVEPRNERRSGWSGASRVRIETPQGPLSLFVKRQENHCYRSLRHPFRGRPTFYREWCNIRMLRAAGVPTLDPIFYGERLQEGRYQAVLISLALDEFRELDRLFERDAGLDEAQSSAMLAAVAELLVRFHRTGSVHNSLSGAHLMLRMDAGGKADVRLLDLEKMKTNRDMLRSAASDLARLIRYTPTLSAQHRVNLVRAYSDAFPPGQRDALIKKINAALHDNHARRGRREHPAIDLG